MDWNSIKISNILKLNVYASASAWYRRYLTGWFDRVVEGNVGRSDGEGTMVITVTSRERPRSRATRLFVLYLFRLTTKETPKLCVLSHLWGKPLVTGRFSPWRWPVDSPQKGSIMQKGFSRHDTYLNGASHPSKPSTVHGYVFILKYC